MKLMNGVIFGAGLGLIMAGLALNTGGITHDYKLVLYAVGSLLVTIEMTRIFSRFRKKT